MSDPITDKLLDNIGYARGTDYFLMKEQLTQEETAILREVRQFGERKSYRSSIPTGNAASFPSNLSLRSQR